MVLRSSFSLNERALEGDRNVDEQVFMLKFNLYQTDYSYIFTNLLLSKNEEKH